MKISQSVKLQMEYFTKSIRFGSKIKDLELYREFIVSNIESVLENTFPYFNAYASDKNKNDLVEYFLQQNNSSDPAFHQIATEFVKCAKNIALKAELKQLIEFEWLIFNTEIMTEKPFDNGQINIEVNYKETVDIDANLTLNFISLPFEICDLDKNFDIVDDIFYAVYRNFNDRVTYQKVSMVDYLILKSLINDGIKKTLELISYENLNTKYKNDFLEKIINWHNQNMIRLNFKGEKNDK